MKEFTSTVTLTFDINNHEAIDKNDYIRLLKLQYQDLYNLEIKDYEITNIQEAYMLFSTSIPQYDLPQSPILIIGFFGIFFTLVLLYFVNRAYFDSPLIDDKRG